MISLLCIQTAAAYRRCPYSPDTSLATNKLLQYHAKHHLVSALIVILCHNRNPVSRRHHRWLPSRLSLPIKIQCLQQLIVAPPFSWKVKMHSYCKLTNQSATPAI
uniref:Uncharacterized protein n=1 Tax=Bionectria ochroleuca TaxID=29856 RepID=A0A8H7NCW8_BIOOC